MNKEARYILRLDHQGTYTPADAAPLLSKVRDRVHPLKGKAINLRVSRKAVEFDLFCEPEAELHPFLSALEPLGVVLSYKRLDGPPPVPAPSQAIAEARSLFNEERYWEAHEVLEGLWKTAQGSEKQLLQGWILTAAALVHAQKNESGVAGPMLEDAARRLQNQPATYYGLDVKQFLRHVKKTRLMKNAYFPTV